MIVGAFTGLLGPGGIQMISRHTAAVLTAFTAARGRPGRVLSLNDPPGIHELAVDGYAFRFEGFGRHKGRFTLAVASAARRTSLAYIGHPNLAPFGLLLRLVRPAARYAVATYGIDVWERLPFPGRLGLRGASIVTVLSAFTGERMIAAQRLDRRKVRLVPPALDPTLLRSATAGDDARTALPAGRVLLTVARLAASERPKGVDTVVHALPRVLEAVPDTLYVVVGDGDDRPELERLAEESGVAQRVVFAGTKVGEELATYY
ncbi:MAG: glycosyltransferase, partial [Chloroflexi bacterium]|nr:glycosyltransferase [Chloroflexota bacterium]